ncbi:MAG: flagellar motor switch protein FliN [Pseudomonadales bacterium]|nr:flagellar motor switch protein FliN [Pseudomonadales bacterium]MCP5184757.1 flagellar motor switch protein FliN [Pseudomonadales bacterium]
MAEETVKSGTEESPMAREASRPQNLDVVLDIPVRLSMEVGNTSISIRKLLKLNKGSIVELSRSAGEPLDVMVNGTLVARGEVVLVNDKFGVRLLDVMSPEQRLQSLN